MSSTKLCGWLLITILMGYVWRNLRFVFGFEPRIPRLRLNSTAEAYRFSFLASQATTTFDGSMASESNCISITLPYLSIR